MNSAQEYKELADSLKRNKELDAAVENYLRALELDPSYFNAHANLSLAYSDLGDQGKAIHHGLEAIRLNPDMAELYCNLGDIYRHAGDLDNAQDLLLKAVSLKPELVHAHFNLAILYTRNDDLEKSINSYQNVIALQPDKIIAAKAYNYIGSLLLRQGTLKESIKNYRKAISINVDDAEARSNLLYALCADPFTSNVELYSEHLEWEKNHGVRGANTKFGIPGNAPKEGRLRIGYVSADFRNHSVAFFLEPILRNHDKTKFEIFCYCNNEIFDDTTELLSNLSEHWRNITNESDDSVVKSIANDGVNILIDLSGHTAGNRMPVFARKPAAVQATWLGYPSTTGLSTIDYRFTDEISDPEGIADEFHSEKLIRMEDGFLCYQGDDGVILDDTPPCFGKGYVTFASFNNITKINSVIVELWSKVLHRTPNSRFLVKTSTLTDDKGKAYCLELFAKNGIEEDRIDWHFRLPKASDHLKLYNQIDIALDTYPYNGTTTTFEALWMGVPVVTLSGDRHASRVSASILKTLKLDSMVAETGEQFVETAIKVANDFNGLSKLRRELRSKLIHSPLCDAKGFTKKMERAYKKMWKDYLKEN